MIADDGTSQPVQTCPIGSGLGTAPKAEGTAAPAAVPQHNINACAYKHGSVGIVPFPGYVHGNNPKVCPNGCKPDAALGEEESLKDTLIREALEYQELYHHEMGSSKEVKEARKAEVLHSIAATGTYSHTWDELQHGARVAWRNAPKCSNRKFAMELNLLDCRDVDTPQGMYEACLDMLERATVVGATETFMTVFRPAHPLHPEEGGPRVWNTQLLRFAGYRLANMDTRGDPSELAFTEMCRRNFGWVPPGCDDENNAGGRFDILPLVLQTDPLSAPQLFHVPTQYSVMIPMSHPRHAWFTDLNLKWYGVPAVSNMELTLGGLLYTGIPFSGWYADTEICRNLTDESRYNLLPEVAAALGYNIATNASLWRDAALCVINEAVVHSFQSAGMGMVDHHTLMQGFWEWQAAERRSRGYMPGNWKWIIPPLASATSKCYLGLNKMTEYTIKPALLYAPGFKKYALDWFGKDYDRNDPPMFPIVFNPWVMRWLGRRRRRKAATRCNVLVLYATVSGVAKTYASKAAATISREWSVTVKDVVSFSPGSISWANYHAVCFLTSTYGSGAPPVTATKFLKWLSSQGETRRTGVSALADVHIAVFGLGSTAYPRFCAAADSLHALLLAAGAEALTRVGKADALGDGEAALGEWLSDLATALVERNIGVEGAKRLMEYLATGQTDTAIFTPLFTTINMAGLKRMAVDSTTSVATVKACKEQLSDGAIAAAPGRSTKLVRFDISAVHIHYEPGDHIVLYPTVHRFEDKLEALGKSLGLESSAHYPSRLDMPFDMEEQSVTQHDRTHHCQKFPLPNTYRVILGEHCALMDLVDRDALAHLATYAGSEADAAELKGLGSNGRTFHVWQMAEQLRWIDLFTVFPSLAGRVPVAIFLQLIPLVQPRYYSIASSLDAHPGEVHVLVGRAMWELPDGSSRAGQCSDFITSLHPGTPVRFKIARVPTFRLPMNTRAPVIMIAAGTGLAPLRGFLQARQAARRRGVLGPSVLLFGCRSRKDQLCKEEVDKAIKDGALTRASIAYSRQPAQSKQYVQDLVSGQATWLRHLLRATAPEAHVYVCGDSLMANGVSAALASLIGAEALAAICKAGRYHEDVFGATRLDVGDATSATADGRDAQRGLLQAAQRGDLKGVQEKLAEGGDLGATDDDGNTLLHLAAANNNVDVVKALLAGDAAPPLGASNNWGVTALALATIKGHTQVAAVLDAAGSTVAGLHAYYPLHHAAIKNDIDAVNKMLVGGADANIPDWAGATPLQLAAGFGSTEVVKRLLDAGASANSVDSFGHTPLACALTFRQSEAVAELKAMGARVISSAPSATNFSRTNGGGSKSLTITPDVAATAKAMWAWLAQDSYPDDVQAKLTAAGVALFHNLFAATPQLKVMFPFKDAEGAPLLEAIETHGLKVMKTMGTVINRLGDLPGLMPYLTDLAQRHIKYGVKLEHYHVLGAALSATLQDCFGPEQWGQREAYVWGQVVGVLAFCAKMAYMRAAAEDEAIIPEAATAAETTGSQAKD